MKPIFFATPSAFRAWLDANHNAAGELLVGFYKRGSGKQSMTWPESVDEALCFGWIDGVRRSIDEDCYSIRFTPRKPRSRWSDVNVRRAQALVELGLMRAAGARAFAQRNEDDPKYSYEHRKATEFDAKMVAAFRENTHAWDFFQAQPKWYRRTATFWVLSAKKDETRQNRFATLLADSKNGERVKPLRRLGAKDDGSSARA